ncbi:hypothetical protein GUITHDRAFT_102528 [Guillardia theta CCMP2712]|uniref:Uncharacterized protein n=1 Tax=Guillardia theta (strain CCMP2712) TaxID=905079 RepID=L1JUN6_GUITC|nr:hypothetical protein GUITHDRAFT_102528 [Guillardia theta CCMP2712]EKX51915.1 hypothetical protein GUITHDRAFT_102528 [Guillardia theta CCMP2712]|mmetsp:Transcript_927/g.2924  ORF Transcript_927/g.2924 Transcript_927/m.2924 type:complete len:81 (-) Transcript_927:109-351(-)|eukprot:XP_005838895.1 hypothetical protein GUITHDRAFT_102528 [Guillardia theta CCMP2712]
MVERSGNSAVPGNGCDKTSGNKMLAQPPLSLIELAWVEQHSKHAETKTALSAALEHLRSILILSYDNVREDQENAHGLFK